MPIQMKPAMNRLNLGRRTQIVSALVEGNSIRSTERQVPLRLRSVLSGFNA